MRRARTRVVRWSGVLALVCLAPGVAATQVIEPFRVRNLSPLISLFGLPAWETPVAEGRGQAAVTMQAANHYRFSQRGAERLMLDGETWRTTFSYRRRIDERWWVGVEVPHYRLSGGVLDGVIDGWHSAFGLPEGGRGARRRGQLLVHLEDGGGAFFYLDGRQRGIGDVQLGVGRILGPGGALLRATVKLPTGDEAMLAGSGAGDWSLTLFRPQSATFRNRPAGYYWGIGASRLGDPKRIAYAARDWAYVAVVGGSWQLVPRAGIKLQVDAHTALYDSSLKELGRTAVQGTLGGWWTLGSWGAIEFGMSEDLVVGASPDFALHAGLQWRF